ncbi:DUF4386 family protein [Blastococcus sp. SYSU D00669]
MSKILDRVADAGGILFVVLVFTGYVGFVAPHMPASLADPEAVRAHLVDHPPTTGLWVGAWLEATGLAALVLLATRIAARIRAADPGGWLPSAAVGLAVAAFTVKLASFAPTIAALHVGRYDAGTVTALLDLNDSAFGLSWALDGAFALLLGLGALAVGALPRWLALLGAVAGAAVLVGTAVPAVYDPLQLVFLVWAVTASGWLLLRGDRAPVALAVPA